MKFLLPATLILALSSPALGQHAGGLIWLSGEIRGQIATVETHARATLGPCDDADDVLDELRDLCREMDRFEACLQHPIVTRGQLRELARRARDVDEEVCDLQEEVEEALEDLRDDYRRFGHRGAPAAFSVQPVGYTVNRAVLANHVDTHRLSQTRGYTAWQRSRSKPNVSFHFGGRSGPVIRVGVGPAFGIPSLGPPTLPPIAGPLPAAGLHPGGFHNGGLPLHRGDASCDLEREVRRLRGLTRQLRRIVGG